MLFLQTYIQKLLEKFHHIIGNIIEIFLDSKFENLDLQYELVLDLWKLYYIQMVLSQHSENKRFLLTGVNTGNSSLDVISCDWSLLKYLSQAFEKLAPNEDFKETLALLERGFKLMVPSGELNFCERFESSQINLDQIADLVAESSAFDYEVAHSPNQDVLKGLTSTRYSQFIKKHYIYKGSGTKRLSLTHFGRRDNTYRTTRAKGIPKSYLYLGEAHYVACQFSLNYMRRLGREIHYLSSNFQKDLMSLEDYESEDRISFQADEDIPRDFSCITLMLKKSLEAQSLKSTGFYLNKDFLVSYNKKGLSSITEGFDFSLSSRDFFLFLDALKKDMASNEGNETLLSFLSNCYKGNSLEVFLRRSPYAFSSFIDFLDQGIRANLSLGLNRTMDVEKVLILSMVAARLIEFLEKDPQRSIEREKLFQTISYLMSVYDSQLLASGYDNTSKLALQQSVFFFLSNKLDFSVEEKIKRLSFFISYKSRILFDNTAYDKKRKHSQRLPGASEMFTHGNSLEDNFKGYSNDIVLFFASYQDRESLKFIEQIEMQESCLSAFLSNIYSLQGSSTSQENPRVLILNDDHRNTLSNAFLSDKQDSKDETSSKKNKASAVKKACELNKSCSELFSTDFFKDYVSTDSEGIQFVWTYDPMTRKMQMLSKKAFAVLNLETMAFSSFGLEINALEKIVQEVSNRVLGDKNLSVIQTLEPHKDRFCFLKGDDLAKRLCSVFVNISSSGLTPYLIYNCGEYNPLRQDLSCLVLNNQEGLLGKADEKDMSVFKVIGRDICFSGRKKAKADFKEQSLVEFSPIYLEAGFFKHPQRPGQVLYHRELNSKSKKGEVNLGGQRSKQNLSFLQRIISCNSSCLIWVSEQNYKEIQQIDLPLMSFLSQEPLSLVKIGEKLCLNLHLGFSLSENQDVKGISHTRNHLLFENESNGQKLLLVQPIFIEKRNGHEKTLENKTRDFYLNSFGEIKVYSDERGGLDDESIRIQCSCFIYKQNASGEFYGETYKEKLYLIYLYCLNEDFSQAFKALRRLNISKDHTLDPYEEFVFLGINKDVSPSPQKAMFLDELVKKVPLLKANNMKKLGKDWIHHLDGIDRAFLLRSFNSSNPINRKVVFEKHSLLKGDLDFTEISSRQLDGMPFPEINLIDKLREVRDKGFTCFRERDKVMLFPSGLTCSAKSDSANYFGIEFFVSALMALNSCSEEEFVDLKKYLLSARILYSITEKSEGIANTCLSILKAVVLMKSLGRTEFIEEFNQCIVRNVGNSYPIKLNFKEFSTHIPDKVQEMYYFLSPRLFSNTPFDSLSVSTYI